MYSSIVALCCTFGSNNVNLVGGFKHDFYFPFHIWDVIHCHWPIFFRWVGQPQTSNMIEIYCDRKDTSSSNSDCRLLPIGHWDDPRRQSKTSKAIEAEGRRAAALSFDGPPKAPKKPGAGLWKMAIWMIYRYLPIENLVIVHFAMFNKQRVEG